MITWDDLSEAECRLLKAFPDKWTKEVYLPEQNRGVACVSFEWLLSHEFIEYTAISGQRVWRRTPAGRALVESQQEAPDGDDYTYEPPAETLDTLRAENARLRAALEDVLTFKRYTFIDTPTRDVITVLQDQVKDMQEIARDALKGDSK